MRTKSFAAAELAPTVMPEYFMFSPSLVFSGLGTRHGNVAVLFFDIRHFAR